MVNEHSDNTEAIAVIGMDGRFPGARDIAEYWSNLLAGRETLEQFSDEALDASVPESLRGERDYVRVRGLMPEADRFDAAFFGISPREAEILDPQQRVFLEMCWRALEDAGYAPGTHDVLTGVFGGMSNNTYYRNHVSAHPDVIAGVGEMAAMIANEKDYLTTRVGYKLNLRGPCVNVTTACSTSLVATCHAINSLLDYQCDIALAGGVAVSCPQERGYLYQEGSIFSRDGHCRPFDKAAGGTVFSNGGGVVVLKRLSDARADNDTIHAVIRGAAMNNDGADKVSFTAPSVTGQAEVVAMAQAMAGVLPTDIDYIEAHGTGTSLGDPVEVAALAQAFGDGKPGSCRIGSVKGNIGHLDAASGIAGLIKAVLSLREGRIPPTLHFSAPNPRLELGDTPFVINDRLHEWKVGEKLRRAAVSSFGLGGTNAHVVLEQAPPATIEKPRRANQLLVLSARTKASLDSARTQLAEFLQRHKDIPLADAAWSLQCGRQAFDHRFAVVAASGEDAARLLANPEPGCSSRGVRSPARRNVFMFPGQGSQRLGMVRRLYEEEPLLREMVDRCAEALAGVLDFDLRDVMFGRIDNAGELLDETAYTQPALFAVEYALARLWMSWGVQPDCLLGHSIGEFSAAALAGVFELEDAARVVAERGRLMQSMDTGSMLSVRTGEDQLDTALVDGVTVAAANAPGFCVLSGPDAAIRRQQGRLEAKGIECSMLRTSHAFHSPMMDPVVPMFERFLEGISMHAPSIPIVSAMTGETMSAESAIDPAWWAQQLRKPVRFMKAVRAAAGAQRVLMLEVGPGIAASTFATQSLGDHDDALVLPSFARASDRNDDAGRLLITAGRLWTQGMDLDWQAMHAGERRRRIPLPTYRFERNRYWLDAAPAGPEAGAAQAVAGFAPSPEPVSGPAPETSDVPLMERLAELLADISGIPAVQLDPDKGFAALGLDSLLLTQFSQTLRRQFSIDLRFRELLLKHNTLAAVATLLERETGDSDEPADTQDSSPRKAPAATPPRNARLGRRPDGQPAWYVPDPERPGRYLELKGYEARGGR